MELKTNEKIGILLTNLGTPEAPTPEALTVYLREFLSDRRLIKVPRLIWYFILNFYILQTRPHKSAALYEKIWTPEGSPLLVYTRRLAQKLQNLFGKEIPVVMGMRYGKPSLEEALKELQKKKCDRILVLPLYPQYSSATTASTFDAISQVFKKSMVIPDLRYVMQYHAEPEYIAALAESISKFWNDSQKTEGAKPKLIFSFHGIPQNYFREGDPYFYQCHKTAKLVADKLGLKDDAWLVSFQSRFGEEEWLKPYTSDTLGELALRGVKSVDVVCPGFPVDCLETLEEIAIENRKIFQDLGGISYRYIPALNDSDMHAQALFQIAKRALPLPN